MSQKKGETVIETPASRSSSSTAATSTALTGELTGQPRARRAFRSAPSFEVTPIGWVDSPLTDPASAPKAGRRGRTGRVARLRAGRARGPGGSQRRRQADRPPWLDRARPDVLRVHPRGDAFRPQQGVFSTRSPHGPIPSDSTGNDPVDRRRPSSCAQPGSARQDTDHRRETDAQQRHQRALTRRSPKE